MELVQVPMREQLFPDDIENDLLPQTDFGARQRLARIERIEDAMPRLKKQHDDFMLWYKAQAAAYDRQIAYEKLMLQSQLVSTGEQLIRTDKGTVSLTHPVKKNWPKPEDLVKFCNTEKIPDSVKVEMSPKLAVITKYMQATGVIPEGYTEETTTSITIRPPTAKILPEQMADAA